MIEIMIKSKIWYLKKIRLFEEMTSEEMGELDRATRMESVKKKTAIFFPGDPSRGKSLESLKYSTIPPGIPWRRPWMTAESVSFERSYF